MKLKSRRYLIAILPFLLLVLFYELIPILMIVIRSFQPEGHIGFTFDNYISIFTKRLYQQAVVNSIFVSVISSVIGIIIAFFGAKATNEATSRWRSFFINILNMTSNFAGIPLAFAFIILLGNTGILVLLGKEAGISALADFNVYSVNGLLLTYIYFQIPLAILLIIPTFDGLRREWKEAVLLLGGSPLIYWTRVAIPTIMPSLLATLSVLFSNAVAAYATAYALLANNYSLLPIRISEQFVGDIVQRKEFGSALAVVLMLTMVFATLINNYFVKKSRGGAAR
ncbi:MAG TPA: ABC transporter permease subunit [Mobilitalea sp.]|nr:ABC transporter permease subunit [Mobilitalea sp.]